MSEYVPKDMSGSLWVNDRKEKDTHADYQGSCVIDGKQFWISGWKNTSSGGKTYLGLKFKLKEGVPADSGSQTADPLPPEDEIPF